MNIRQRKVAILREMKALKRKFNRLSEMGNPRRSRRRILNDDIQNNNTMYAAGNNRKRNKIDLVVYYYNLGKTHAQFRPEEYFGSKSEAHKHSYDIGVSMLYDMSLNKDKLDYVDETTFNEIRDSYCSGVESAIPIEFSDIKQSIYLGLNLAIDCHGEEYGVVIY